MRLRRETGDFRIKVTYETLEADPIFTPLRPGLSAEDLIGCIVEEDSPESTSFSVVIDVIHSKEDNKFQVISAHNEFYYDPETGEISASDSGML